MWITYFIFIGLYQTSKNVNVFHKHALDLKQLKCSYQQQNPTSEQVKSQFEQVDRVNVMDKYALDSQIKWSFSVI